MTSEPRPLGSGQHPSEGQHPPRQWMLSNFGCGPLPDGRGSDVADHDTSFADDTFDVGVADLNRRSSPAPALRIISTAHDRTARTCTSLRTCCVNRSLYVASSACRSNSR